ncbi:hypothetical protein EOA23_22190 [Mesorhizobium sp. M2A.F.Ca.ET.042.01.1.1]|uniref:hypothetical protein n=1 Tax=Mesorhizobium sp. M2A.F.Ca.ET.042.01.1.1 TaxID=2496745 RepID=UPI000FCB3348|nr:hypothetical protein [Mesorhizobium sp. M2A.F.Ca.ET.042.01.1.1]RUX24356.1 hypothetical protein EOA23_22190 [Mesorhizobium sp. M2A.F.Ca.ET.042.01.1.1]
MWSLKFNALLLTGFRALQAKSAAYCCIFKTWNGTAYRRIALGLLYGLLFIGLALLAYAVRAAHWVADNAGLKAMLACVLVYIGVMSGLVWAINKINKAFPTLDFPPSSTHSDHAWFVDQVAVDIVPEVAHDKSPPIKREKPSDR